MGSVFIFLIKCYQYGIRPLMIPRCRYIPSCSAYGLSAIRHHGACRGLLLLLKRLGRCHPWAKDYGYDPVPLPKHTAVQSTIRPRKSKKKQF